MRDTILHPISMMRMFWVVLQDFFIIFPPKVVLVHHGKIHLRELEEQHDVLEEYFLQEWAGVSGTSRGSTWQNRSLLIIGTSLELETCGHTWSLFHSR